MNKPIRQLTETAAMLALLVALQTLTQPLGQLVTGSCVNAVLAVTVLTVGLSGGVAVAVLSPIAAFLLKIAPNGLVVLPIMLGNLTYILVLHFVAGCSGPSLLRRATAWLTAAIAKFAVLYGIVAGLVCGLFSQNLMDAGLLKAPMLTALPVTFSWMQLVTALVGGAVAMAIVPLLRKALKR